MDTTNTTLSTPNVTSNTGIQVKIPSDIPASTFSNAQSTLAIPNIPTPTVPNISSDSALQQAKAYVAQIQPEQSQAEKDRQTFVQQYKDLLDTPAKESATAQAYKDTGINDIVAQINDYTAQITAIDDLNQAKKLSIGQNVGGLTVSGVQNEETRLDRESAIKKLNISASLAAVQGKFNTAKSLVDQAITIKYADQQAKIDRVKAFLDLNKEDLSKEEKKQSQILAERQRILDEKKANDKSISDMIINASSQNAPSALVAKAQAAKTPSEAAMILGQYAGDYYKTELLKSQIKTDAAQRANYYANAAKTRSEIAKANPVALSNLSNSTDLLKNVIKNTKLAEGAKTSLISVLGVNNAIKDFANSNQTASIEGIGNLSGLTFNNYRTAEAIKNRAYLDAVELKTQQWASGASLTKDQEEKVSSLVPKKNDSPDVVRAKIDSLTDFMNQQAKTILEVNGVNYEPQKSALFSNIIEQPVPTEPNIWQKMQGVTQPIQGSSIINKTNLDGTFNFVIPTSN